MSTFEDKKALVNKEIYCLIADLTNGCKGLRALCAGFNLVDELSMTYSQLEAEAKLITNISARKAAKEVADCVKSMIDSYNVGSKSPYSK